MRLHIVFLTLLSLSCIFLLATSKKPAKKAKKTKARRNAAPTPGDPCSCTVDLALQCLMGGDLDSNVLAAFDEMGGEVLKLADVDTATLPEKLERLNRIMEGQEGTYKVNLSSFVDTMAERMGGLPDVDSHMEKAAAHLAALEKSQPFKEEGEKPRERRDVKSLLDNVKSNIEALFHRSSETTPHSKIISPDQRQVLNEVFNGMERFLFIDPGSRVMRDQMEMMKKAAKEGKKEHVDKLVKLLKEMYGKDDDISVAVVEMGLAMGVFRSSRGEVFKDQLFVQLPPESRPS